MQVFDSSSALHAWDNYPIEQFPPLWAWLAQCVARGDLSISGVAFEEVRHKSPDCAAWFKTQQVRVLPMTQAILMDALRIKALLQIKAAGWGVVESRRVLREHGITQGNQAFIGHR